MLNKTVREGESRILPSQGKMALLSEQRKQILTEKRVELVASIQLHGLWSHLRSHKIVTEQDEARIKLNRTSHEQIGKLLDHLAKRTESDFEAFCECLEEDNQGHIVTDILCYSAQSPSNKDESDEVYTLAWHLTEVYQLMEYVLMNLARVTECGSEDELQHISTAPEWAPEFALDSAKFYISLHLQEGETVTTNRIKFEFGFWVISVNNVKLYKNTQEMVN
uniref:CARD domain-containing protein n=1 Tax=Capitella teleta TaxID=283909 RepID=X2A510_CAPTE